MAERQFYQGILGNNEGFAAQRPKLHLGYSHLWKAPMRLLPALAVSLILFTATSAAFAQTSTVLPRGSVWKYEDSGVALDSTWIDPGYADGDWSMGPAPLGFGEPFIETFVSYGDDPADKHRTTYFRTTFDLQDPPESVQVFLLRVNHDDGVVIYLNGVELTRLSMPAGEISHSTLALSHEGGGYELHDLSSSISMLNETGNVLAAEVHQTSAESSDLVLDLEFQTSTNFAIVLRGPQLSIGTPDGVSIRWRTNTETDGRLRYGASPGNLTETVDLPNVGLDHIVTLTGLLPATTYYYSIGTTTERLVGDDAEHHFRTSPTPGTIAPVRIWAIGDSGKPGPGQDNVRDAYLASPGAENTDLWIMLGDNAYDAGTEAEYQAAVFDAYPSLLRTVPLWPTRGNHDVERIGGNNDYYNFFFLPTAGEAGGLASGTEAYYSFDYANIHFVCLDSEGSNLGPAGAMMTWLPLDLAATTADWTIAFWHHPPYTKGSHDSDLPGDSSGKMRDMRENALPILEAHGVDLVLSGHSHSYERSYLVDGHYDVSTTLDPSMLVNGGNGQVGGDGAYWKPDDLPQGNKGAVYITAGNGSKISGGPLNHPVMVSSLNIVGSLVIDVNDQVLDLKLIDDTGTTRDYFTIQKSTAVSAPPRSPVSTLRVAAGPNPFSSATTVRFAVPSAGATRVRVIDALGRRIRDLSGEELTAGEHQVRWDGRDSAGRTVAAGVYFVTVEHAGKLRATKIVRIQ